MQPNPVAMWFPIILMTIPFAFLGGFIASRKAKSPLLFCLLGLIPFVGFYTTFYLLSLPDKSLVDKVDRILALLEKR